MHYYRLYDDEEKWNFFKCPIENTKMRELLEEYERDHQKYLNRDFFQFLKEKKIEVEMIVVENLTY